MGKRQSLKLCSILERNLSCSFMMFYWAISHENYSFSVMFDLHFIYIIILHKLQFNKPHAETCGTLWSCQHEALSLAEPHTDVELLTVKAYSIIIHRFVLLHKFLIKLVLKNSLLSRSLRAWRNVSRNQKSNMHFTYALKWDKHKEAWGWLPNTLTHSFRNKKQCLCKFRKRRCEKMQITFFFYQLLL